MVEYSNKAVTHWAVIIGLNYYPKTPDKCLEGCILDAEAVRIYLKNVLGESLHEKVLEASTPTTPGDPPPEDEEVWPTHDRVIGHLDHVISHARSGHRVVIYYSGHGGESRNRTSRRSECALMLLTSNGRDLQRLRVRTLVGKLDKMVEKGLFVTLILDCCFSGGIIRGGNFSDFAVRYLDNDADSDFESSDELENQKSQASNILRDGSKMNDNWLVDPKGYMVLAACAPDEEAFEVEIHGQRRGALTYFLLHALEVLRDSGIDITHRSVHVHLTTSLHAHWSRQTPMRYGKNGFELFGDSLLAPSKGLVPLYRSKDGQLRLRAGEIHGVWKEDNYIAYPPNGPKSYDCNLPEEGAHIRVITVRPVESDLEEVEYGNAEKIGGGWKARLATSLSPRIIWIGMSSSLTSNKSLPSETRTRHMRVVDVQETSEKQTEESCSYFVAVNDNNEYEVLDTFRERVFPIPTIPCYSDGASHILNNILQHIADFKYLEGLENRTCDQDFQNSFSIKSKLDAGDSNRISISNGEKWEVMIKNKSDKQLYMGIFNFRPSWEVKALTAKNGFVVIPPRNDEGDFELPINMCMSVPDWLEDEGKNSCQDIFKFFITSKATHFRMSLPMIFATAQGSEEPIRGEDCLSSFLLELTQDLRGEEQGQWAAQSFFVHTSKD
jgi:hypothetical protein